MGKKDYEEVEEAEDDEFGDEEEEEEEDGEEGDDEEGDSGEEEEEEEEEEDGEEEEAEEDQEGEEEGEEEGEDEGEEEEGGDTYDEGGEAAPQYEADSSDEELTTGRDAEDIARDRLEKRIFDQSEKEAMNAKNIEEIDPEGLGEDFESTQWCPPTIKGAHNAMHDRCLHHGQGSLWSTNVCSDPDLSAAACLYFQYMKTMATCMAWMTLLALPAMIMSYFGERTPEINKDGIGLYMFTLGNVGYDKTSTTFMEDSACITKSPAITNGTCIHIPFVELDAYYGANILAATEFVQVVVFLYFTWKLNRKRKQLMRDNESEETTIKDYSIMVSDLPRDVRPQQILEHFNVLYNLNSRDSEGRLRVAGAKPIENLEHSQQEMYSGTWVADICIHKKIGKYIRAFRSKASIMEDLRRARARMKMFNEATPHNHGPNPVLYAAAEQRMLELGTKIDTTSGHVFSKNFKLLEDYMPTGHQEHHVHEPKLLEKIDAPVVCAFVTFQYCESSARALEDYGYYGSWPRSLFFPSKMKINGKVVKVEEPPEPDEIVWENLETDWITSFLHKSFTNLIALVFTIVIFAVVVQAAIYKMNVADQVPDMSLCNSHIPATFGYYHNLTDTAAPIMFVRASDAVPDSAATLDESCSTALGGADKVFYGMFTEGGAWDKPVGNYNVDSCTGVNGVFTQCPQKGSNDFCPCFDVISDETCFTQTCTDDERATIIEYDDETDTIDSVSSTTCFTWAAGDMGSCSCVDELTTMIEENSPQELATEIQSLAGSVCAPFFEAYAATTGLTYGISLATVVVNISLKAILRIMCTWEKHTSLSTEQASYLNKVFFACYFCFTFVALIAYGHIDDLPETIQSWYIFQGPYRDFSADWYAEVGLFMVTSFLLTGLIETAKAYAIYYIFYPFRRWWHFPSIERQSNMKYATQKDVDDLLVGPIFEPTKNLGIMLALLFMGMTVAPGIPLFMPFTCILYVITFRRDKLLLLRHYEKPPHAGDATIKNVIWLLPWAAIIRLGFGIWMLGNEDLLETTDFSAADASSVTGVSGGTDSSSYSSSSGRDVILGYLPEAEFPLLRTAVIRAMRPNCLPLFILLCIIIAWKLVATFWKFFPVYWLWKVMKFIKSVFCRHKVKIVAAGVDHTESKKTEDIYENDGSEFITEYELSAMNHHLRQEQAAFTEPYYSYLYDKNNPSLRTGCCKKTENHHELTPAELNDGWVTREKFGRYLIREKKWHRTTTFGGIIRRKGDLKRTYEIMDENGCISYELDQVPAYKLAMNALEEGIILAAEAGTHDEEIVERIKKKNRSVLDGYSSQKVERREKKTDLEDWEVDDDQLNSAYKRVVSKKETKASAELNASVGDTYMSHEVDDDSGGSDGDVDLGAGLDFL
jgi:hypothetical protein